MIESTHRRRSRRSRRRHRILAAAAMASIFLLAMLLAASSLPSSRAQPRDSHCETRAQRMLHPERVALGESVHVTLTFHADCWLPPDPLHLVFVVDASESMNGPKLDAAVEALHKLIRGLDLEADPNLRVGVVAFAEEVLIECDLSDDARTALACLDGLESGGSSRAERGLAAGMDMLRRGRALAPNQVLNELLVLASDGHLQGGCDAALDRTREIRAEGALLITLCAGSDCDRACMLGLASSERYAIELDQAALVLQWIQRFHETEPRWIPLREITVTEILPTNMHVQVGRESPRASWNLATRELIWDTGFAPRSGLTFTFELVPLEIGLHPAGRVSTIEFRDILNRGGRWDLPIDSVQVLPEFIQLHLPILSSNPRLH